MALSVGERLGRYDVTALNGEGGMDRSIGPATPAWTAPSPSRSSLSMSRQIRRLCAPAHGSSPPRSW